MRTQEEHKLKDEKMVEMLRVDGVFVWPWNEVNQLVETVFGPASRREAVCKSSNEKEQCIEVDDNTIESVEGS